MDGENLEEMDFLPTDARNASTSQPTNFEVSLENETSKPSSTEELKGMLQKAGTDLTIKYLTGQITYEEFSRHLEQSKSAAPKAQGSGTKPQSSTATQEPSNLPNFELMMDQNFSGDEEESDEDNEEEQMDIGEDDSELLDSEEWTDSKDQDWEPGKRAKKVEKETGKKKNLKQGREKKTLTPKEVIRKPRKQRRKVFDLPKVMAGTNGKAMLLRAQGKTDEAVELFYEVIKQAPKAAAPYEALGSIQEERGNIREAIKFYMVAANLRGKHATEWLDILEMCLKLNDDKLAWTCFVKGMTAASTNEGKIRILARKSAYFNERGNHTKSLQTREQMLPYLERENPSNTLTFARDLVHDYLEAKEVNGAISTLQFITREYSNDIDSEDIHSLVELYMDQKNYLKGVETIIRHCGITATFSSGVPSPSDLAAILQGFSKKEQSLLSLDFPALMPIDLKSKLLQCLVRMKVLPNLDVLKGLVESIVTMDAEDYGDVYYDVAETMVVCDYHLTALPILETLVSSEKYNEAAVWLTLGQCRNALGDLPAATEAYKCVVDMAPGHHEARVTLASLLQQMGHHEKALQVLSRESEEGFDQGDKEILLHKCQLLHSQGKTQEFIAAARRLLSLNLPSQFNPDMVRSFMNMKTAKARKNASLPKRLSSQEPRPTDSQHESKTGKNMNQFDKLKFLNNFWEIFCKLCRTLRDLGMEDKLMETTALGITCPIFTIDVAASKNVEFLCLKAGPVNDNVYHLARNIASEESNNPQGWNLYNYILTRMKGVGMDLRFTFRSLMKNPNSIPLSILNGNERLISGTYTQAL
ncbi:general transcription factor 3C polypeptide 3, partial [Elysia marginata]